MIAFPAGARVWIAGGVTDMRCGMNSLALKVQQGLGRDPHGGEIFCFRGRKGDLIKVLWHDGVGMSLYLKRLEAGKFIWPVSQNGSAVPVSAAQLGYLLEGIVIGLRHVGDHLGDRCSARRTRRGRGSRICRRGRLGRRQGGVDPGSGDRLGL